jgi:hypothetical protein
MKPFLTSAAHALMQQTHRLFAMGRVWMVTVGLPGLLPLFTPSPALADSPGHWNLDDGSGHRLGVMLEERSDIHSPSKLDHTRPLVLSDGHDQDWSLANRSRELIATAGGAIPVGSSQYDAGCLTPIPCDGMPLQMTGPSSSGDLSFALSAGQVESFHSLTGACANVT